MREESAIFKILLSCNDIYKLYANIGESLCTDIDIYNCNYNRESLNNSLILLQRINFICKKNNRYYKLSNYNASQFGAGVCTEILSAYEELILKVFKSRQYDVQSKRVYVQRNRIPLKYSGLIMLLEDLEEVCFDNNRIILGEKIRNLFSKNEKTGLRKISLSELQKRLVREEELGEEAEQFVMDYEQKNF